jgi:hypothetical protein
VFLLGEDPGDGVLDPLQIEAIGDHALASLEVCHGG